MSGRLFKALLFVFKTVLHHVFNVLGWLQISLQHCNEPKY